MKKTYIAPAIVMEHIDVTAALMVTSLNVSGSSNNIVFTDEEVGDEEEALVKGNWADIW